MKHRKILALLIVFWCLGANKLYANAIQINQGSGAKSFYALDSIRKIVFSNGSMVIEDKDSHVHSYSIAQTLILSFTDSIPDSTGNDPSSTLTTVAVSAHQTKNALEITFLGSSIDRSLELFNTDGVLLQSIRVTNSNYVALNLYDRSPGIYVCKITNGHHVQSLTLLIK